MLTQILGLLPGSWLQLGLTLVVAGICEIDKSLREGESGIQTGIQTAASL